MHLTRRETLKAAAMFTTSACSGRAFAETQCAPGLVVVRVEVKKEYVYVEGEISVPRRFGPTVKFKIPVPVRTHVVVCEPPPPPKDDNTPKHGWNPGGPNGISGAWFLADPFGFEGYFSGLSVRARLPPFARLSAAPATLTTVARLANGTTATLQNTLSYSGSEFRVSDISRVKPFAESYGRQIVSLQQQVTDIEIEAYADGAETLGLDTHYYGNALLQTERLLHVSSGPANPPPVYTDPFSGRPNGN